jgi:hypothetical protein
MYILDPNSRVVAKFPLVYCILKFSTIFFLRLASPFFRPAIKAITVCRVIAHSRIRNSQRRYAKLLN